MELGNAPPSVNRHSFNDLQFASAETLLNSTMNNPFNMLSGGSNIGELLQNQMPGHKMSIDFTNGAPRQNDTSEGK